MDIVQKRALAHQLIDEANSKLLSLVIDLMNGYNDQSEFTPAEIAEIEEQIDAIDRGEVEMLSEEEFWASVKKPEGRDV